jgi:hypothetical protein
MARRPENWLVEADLSAVGLMCRHGWSASYKAGEFTVEPDAARRGDVLTVSGRVAAGDSAVEAGMVWVEFDIGQGPEYRTSGVIDADGRFSIDVLAVETGEWSAHYDHQWYVRAVSGVRCGLPWGAGGDLWPSGC